MKLKIYGTEQKPGEDVRKKIDSSLCHDECLTYCTGTENYDCNQCKNLFYVDELDRKVWAYFSFSHSQRQLLLTLYYFLLMFAITSFSPLFRLSDIKNEILHKYEEVYVVSKIQKKI